MIAKTGLLGLDRSVAEGRGKTPACGKRPLVRPRSQSETTARSLKTTTTLRSARRRLHSTLSMVRLASQVQEETIYDDRHGQTRQSFQAHTPTSHIMNTFGHFSRYVSLIYTVALETNAFDPSYPTNIVPLSDLSISIRVLEPLCSGLSHFESSSSP